MVGRLLIRFIVAVALFAIPVVHAATDVSAVSAEVNAKLPQDLMLALSQAPADELLPIAIVMRDQVGQDRLDEAAAKTDMIARRRAVIALLKPFAAQSQRDILGVLRAGQATGKVGSDLTPLWISNIITAELSVEMILEVATRDDVRYVIYDPVTDAWFPQPEADPNALDGIECGVAKMDAPRVWDELGITGRGALISVTDSGTCYQHPDMADHIWKNPGEVPNNGKDDDNNGYIDDIVGWDFENDDNDPADSLGHGTHVGGTMAGDGTQGTQTGMAPDAMLMVQRIGSERGIQAADVWESMQYSVDMSVRLQSMSFGWRGLPPETRAVWRTNCNNTIAGGTAMVVAAANSGACGLRTCVATPGDVPAVITVGATDCNDVIAGFSSRGPVQWKDVPGFNDFPYPPGLIKPSVSAPGVATVSAKFSGCTGYRSLSGTSMATPHVSGAIGLMIEANPNISPEEMKDILMDTALDLGAEGKDNAYGAGRVNAYEAVLAAMVDPEPAACCFGNGGCKDLLRKKCLKKDGRYNFGQECGSFDCPKPGACCIDNSTCDVMLERECISQGGDFKGEGEKCKLACPCDL
ncbi:MAG: S8 family serine peptidase, partial [Planctomycetes bacterium]|nr:S8 family serine peptidase [Planctomycetota bacterium]